MDGNALLRLCRSMHAMTEEHPWGPEDTVFKVGGKAFAFTGTSRPTGVTLKFDVEDVEPLRHLYPGTVTVPHYLTRGGWSNVALDGTVPDDELRAWVRRSYEIVASGLTRKVRAELGIEVAAKPGRR